MRLTILPGLAVILLRLLGYGLLGSVIVAITIYIQIIDNRFDLSIWHHVDLDEEFTLESDVTSFSQYLELEDRLLAQLDELVYASVPRGKREAVNRYSRGSLSDPSRWPVNWNRSFVLPND